MHQTRRPIVIFSFVLLPLFTAAQNPSTGASDEVISRITDAVGLENQLEQAPQTIRQQFDNNPFGLPAEDNELLIKRFEEGFIADSLMDTAVHTFREQLDEKHAASTLNWLEREATQRVTRAEKEFYTLQGLRKRIIAKYEMEQDPPSEKRDSLVKSLVQATSAVETTVESYATIFRSVISAFGKLSKQQNFSESQIDSFTENYRMQIRPEVEQEVINQFLIMYYDLENETLVEYISFYNTETGNWLSNAVSESKHAAFEAAADRFLQSIDSTQ